MAPDHSTENSISEEVQQEKSRQKFSLKNYFGWVSYDIANTFYAYGILTLLALTWVLVRGQKLGLSYNQANAMFQITLSVASIFMALMLPILGSISDVLNERKRFVLLFTAICLISTFLFSITTNIILILILFAISMIAYQWAQVFYDAMLQNVVPPGREARLSSLAIALGYIGGGIVVVYATFLASNNPDARPSNGPITLGYLPNLILLIIAGYALFTIPLIFVKEFDWASISAKTMGDTIEIDENPGIIDIAKSSLTELVDTFVNIFHNNTGMFFYIISYFIIADFANLIVLINTTYLRDGLALSENQVLYTTMISGISIILLSYGIGRICDRWGAKRGFQFIGILWLTSLVMMILIEIILPIGFIYVVAVFFGPAFSGVWISQRQMVLELVPTDQEIGRYFGLTKFSGKISSALGPLFWALLFSFAFKQLHLTTPNSYRFALMGMGIILLLGFLLLHFKVPNRHEEFKQRKQELLDAYNSIS